MPSSATNQVTHAVQGQKIDALTAAVIELTGKLNLFIGETSKCVNLLEKQAAVHTEQIDTLKSGLVENRLNWVDCDNKIDGVIQKTNWWSGMNTALGLAANAVAAFFATKKF